MYQKKSGRLAWLKYALAVPVLFVLTMVFANRTEEGIVHQDSEIVKESVDNTFNKAELIILLSDLMQKTGENSEEDLEKNIHALIKDYLIEYPDDQEEIIKTLSVWGSPHQYVFMYNFDQDIVKYAVSYTHLTLPTILLV